MPGACTCAIGSDRPRDVPACCATHGQALTGSAAGATAGEGGVPVVDLTTTVIRLRAHAQNLRHAATYLDNVADTLAGGL